MKFSLVVGQGAHQGKVIPVTVAEFVIGRDPDCQLRPASASISKKHCAFVVRDGKVTVKDFGSTNGTFVNDARVEGERELADGDRLKVGPLDFVAKIERSAPVKAAPKPAAEAPKAAAATAAVDVDYGEGDDGMTKSEKMAALLLAADDTDTVDGQVTEEQIPSGSTVMELPAMPQDEKKPADPKKAGKPASTQSPTTSAAEAILKQYMRRPRS